MGSFVLEAGRRRIALPPAVQRVVAFLALAQQPLERTYVSGCLWPDRSEEKAAASLRTAVWRLRRADPGLLREDTRRLALRSSVSVDVNERSALAAAVLRGRADDEESLAVLCRPGELLPDWYEDWLELERERYRLLRVRALERLAETLPGRDRLAEATEAGVAAVTAEPLRETAHRALIRVFIAEGNAFEAVRQFRLCRALMRQHLGTEPSEETARLVRDLAPGASW